MGVRQAVPYDPVKHGPPPPPPPPRPARGTVNVAAASEVVGLGREHHMARVLVESEMAILSHLVDAWNIWTSLPDRHPDELNEVRLSIHRLQDILASRAVWRMTGTK